MRDISNKMFTQTACALEKDGLIQRKMFPVVPPRVEYSLTPLGESAIPVIMQLGYWANQSENPTNTPIPPLIYLAD